MEYLHLGGDFDQPVDYLPDKLQVLHIPRSYKQQLDHLPHSLIVLRGKARAMDHLPPLLSRLTAYRMVAADHLPLHLTNFISPTFLKVLIICHQLQYYLLAMILIYPLIIFHPLSGIFLSLIASICQLIFYPHFYLSFTLGLTTPSLTSQWTISLFRSHKSTFAMKLLLIFQLTIYQIPSLT